MADYLKERIAAETDTRLIIMFTRLLQILEEEDDKPIVPQPGQMVLPGFEGIMGFSVVV